ncbi:hypothetical protein SH1V18_39300 [Vallitalea longa]|uniref:Xylose isomerase-like TIM barrel domain-containing protein n=1 Tax=Vallitalea longa TaxID=2936439 RepID=A0A9W5YCF3_9FIRM|nr:sugar phosphate isomerase/epimerase family protein [Vallitalea longa]GKX31450.1 hypothetical protein SH1V18_39300 [Vallitalea longa]
MSQFVLTGFSDEISPDFSVQLEEMKKLGIEYIEIRGVNGKNIVEHSIKEVNKIKKEMDSIGIKVSAIGSPIGKIKITDDFENHFETFKHIIEIAKVLETKYIRMFSFYIETADVLRYRDEVIKRLKILVNYAEQQDIILLHENEKDIYGDIPERCLDLYNTINSSHFQLIFDPANYVQCNITTYPNAFNTLKDKVTYYHIKDAVNATGEVVPSGKGDGHIFEIISELKNCGYKGFLSLEPHLGDFVGFSNLESDGDIPKFKEASDAGKFKLAFNSLMKIIREV